VAAYAEKAAVFYDRAIAEGKIRPLIQVIPHSGGPGRRKGDMLLFRLVQLK
jgi:hypothetical protein